MNRTRHAITGILLMLGVQGWAWGLSLIEVAIVPRYLGPGNIGKLSLASSVLSAASVLVTFGGANQIVRTIAAGAVPADRFLTTVIVFRTVIGVPIIVCLCLLVALVVPDRLVVVLTALAGINAYLTWMLESLFAYRRAQARFTTFARAEMTAQTVSVFAKAGLVVAGFGAAGAAFGEILRSIVGLVSAWFSRGGRPRITPIRRRDLEQLIRAGVPYFQYNVCLWMYGASTTSYMLCAFASYEANGWFDIAQRLLGLLFVLPSAAVTVLMPLLTQACEESPDSFRSFARRSVNPLMALSIPFALLFILRADDIMYALGLYRRGFAEVPVLLQIFGIGLPLRWASMYYGMLLIASGRVQRQARAALYAAPFNLLLTAGLVITTHRVWHNGAIGATISAELTELLIVLVYVRGLDDPALVRANLGAVGRGLVAGILPALVLYFVPMPGRWGVIAAVMLTLLLYFPLAIVVGAIRRDEISQLTAMARTRAARQIAPVP